MKKEIRNDGIKIIALLVLFTLLSYIVPFFSFLIYIIWPIPIVYFMVKYDIREAIFVIVLTAVLNTLVVSLIISIPAGIIMGMYSITGFGLIGFFLGSGIKERFSPLKALIMTIIGSLISNLVLLYSLPYIAGFSYQEIFSGISSMLEQDPLIAEFSFALEQSLYLMRLLFPSIIMVSSIILGTLIYYISIWYLNKKEMNVKVYKPLREWSFPRWWISLGIVFVLIVRTYLQYNVFPILPDIINIIILNTLVLLLFLVFLQGLAVLIHYLGKIKSGFLKMIIIFSLVLFNFQMFYILALLGFIDMWFNLRKVKTS